MELEKINDLFKQKLHIINMGLATFADSLKKKDINVVQMDWHPPAGGNEKLIALLKKLGR